MNRQPEWHILRSDEVAYSVECLEPLKQTDWAAPLLSRINEQGGPTSTGSRPLLFEARFGYELYRSGIQPGYEHKAGVGESTIDFAIETKTDLWLIELVSADETEAVVKATYEQELMGASGDALGTKGKFLELRSDAADQRRTIAGEMLKLQEKLYEKVERDGQPHKFPLPQDGTKHAIIIDARGFGGGHGPRNDEMMQLLYGPEQVKEDWLVQYFGNNAVLGVFDRRNTRPGALLLQERIHLVGFVVEKEFGAGKIREQVSYRPNHLLSGDQDIFDSFPLKRATPVLSTPE